MTELGLSVCDFYSTISDHDLDLSVSALKVQYPNSGYWMAGLLLQQGVRVKQVQLRESMHRVDPNGQMERVHSKEAVQCAISPSFVASRRKSQADKVCT